MTMFYFLSKALYFLLQPSVWIMGLVLWAVLEQRPSLKKRLLVFALSIFLIFGNSVLFNEVMNALEPTYLDPEHGQYELAVVLGGYADHNSKGASIEFYRSADRITKALELYQEGKVNKLVLSSGVHPDGHPELNEAELSAKWLISCGVAEHDIIKESSSWNTFQNAFATSHILDSLDLHGKFLVITSASHVRRARACFEKQGLEVGMLAVDHYSKESDYSFSDFIFPSMRIVLDWEVPIKETVGTLVYKLQGYI